MEARHAEKEIRIVLDLTQRGDIFASLANLPFFGYLEIHLSVDNVVLLVYHNWIRMHNVCFFCHYGRSCG